MIKNFEIFSAEYKINSIKERSFVISQEFTSHHIINFFFIVSHKKSLKMKIDRITYKKYS